MFDTFSYFLVTPGGETDQKLTEAIANRMEVGKRWEALFEELGACGGIHNDGEYLIAFRFEQGKTPNDRGMEGWKQHDEKGEFWVPTEDNTELLERMQSEDMHRIGAVGLAESLGVKTFVGNGRMAGGVSTHTIEAKGYDGPIDFMDLYPMTVENPPEYHRIIIKEEVQEGSPPDCKPLTRSEFYAILGQ